MPYPHDPGSKAAGTSEDAAEAITNHAATVRNRVLGFLTQHHPAAFTADEIADHVGASILSTRPRVTELRRAGLIEPAEQRGRNESGMSAMRWRAKVTP
ncbi:hypothetical protein [Bradyrhizobium cenepequi]